jgi:hypothetical protein
MMGREIRLGETRASLRASLTSKMKVFRLLWGEYLRFQSRFNYLKCNDLQHDAKLFRLIMSPLL